MYGYDVEAKAQPSQQKRPEEQDRKKAYQVLAKVRILLTVVFECNVVVHYKFLPQGRTVSKEYDIEVKRRLSNAIRQKPIKDFATL